MSIPGFLPPRTTGQQLHPMKCLLVVLSRWHWLGLSLMTWMCLGVVYLHLTAPVYEARATLRLEDVPAPNSSGGGKNYALRQPAEIALLRSRSLAVRSLRHLDWKVSYFQRSSAGQNMYPGKPAAVHILRQRPHFWEGRIALKPTVDGFELDDGTGGRRQKRRFRWGERITLPGLIFVVRPLATEKLTRPFAFQFNTAATVAGQIQSGLRVAEQGKISPVLQLTNRQPNARFACDALNALITAYLEQDVQQKRLQAEHTRKVLDHEWHALTLPDINQQNRQEMSGAADKLIQLRLRLSVIDSARRGLTTVPLSNLGPALALNVPSLTQLLDQLMADEQDIRKRSSALPALSPRMNALRESIATRKRQAMDLLRAIGNETSDAIRVYTAQTSTATADRRASSSGNQGRKGTISLLEDRQLENRLAEQFIRPGASVIDEAVPDFSVLYPRPAFVLRSSAFLALLSWISSIVFARLINTRIRGKHHLVSSAGAVPVAGQFPQVPDDHICTIRAGRLLVVLSPDLSQIAQVICVTSQGRGEGKTTIAEHLALGLSSAGKRTLLVKSLIPSANKMWVDTGRPTADAVPSTRFENLFLLEASDSTGSADPLAISRIPELCGRLRLEYDHVVIDGSPLGETDDLLPIIAQSDITLFVVRSGYSPLSAIALAAETGVRVPSVPVQLLLITDREDPLYASIYD